MAGFGAAFLLPAALAILNVTYRDPGARAHAIAIWGGMNGLAMAVGPTLRADSADPRGRPLDLRGQSLAVLLLGALCLGFIRGPDRGWLSPRILACAAIFVASTIAVVVAERRSHDPLIPLGIFGNAAFSAAIGCATLMTFGMYGLLFVLPLYLQAVRGASATMAGIELLPMSALFFLVSLRAGRIANAVGPRILITAGMSLTGAGLIALAILSQYAPFGMIIAPLLAIGAGLGLITGPIATAALANAPAECLGMSSGLVNVGRMVGATLGVAILGMLFGRRIEEAAKNAPVFLQGLRAAFLIGGCTELAGAATAALCFRHDCLQSCPSLSPLGREGQGGGARAARG